jgi:hypothetical protein
MELPAAFRIAVLFDFAAFYPKRMSGTIALTRQTHVIGRARAIGRWTGRQHPIARILSIAISFA